MGSAGPVARRFRRLASVRRAAHPPLWSRSAWCSAVPRVRLSPTAATFRTAPKSHGRGSLSSCGRAGYRAWRPSAARSAL